MEKSTITTLIMGSTGMLGHMVSNHLLKEGYNVVTVSRKHQGCGRNIVGDLTDAVFLQNVLGFVNYDVIVNCVGVLNNDCDDDISNSVFLNSCLPHILATDCHDKGGKLIHISTDCVFSGYGIGGYDEYSLPDGTTRYARTKTLGEVFDKTNLTFRTSIVGPDIDPTGIGILNWFLMNSGLIYGYENHIWSGVTTKFLAAAIDVAITNNVTGLYHLVNNSAISKYDLISLFNNKILNNKKKIIRTMGTMSVNKSLHNTRTDFDFNVPGYDEMIFELSSYMDNNFALYPHYNLGKDC